MITVTREHHTTVVLLLNNSNGRVKERIRLYKGHLQQWNGRTRTATPSLNKYVIIILNCCIPKGRRSTRERQIQSKELIEVGNTKSKCD